MALVSLHHQKCPKKVKLSQLMYLLGGGLQIEDLGLESMKRAKRSVPGAVRVCAFLHAPLLPANACAPGACARTRVTLPVAPCVRPVWPLYAAGDAMTGPSSGGMQANLRGSGGTWSLGPQKGKEHQDVPGVPCAAWVRVARGVPPVEPFNPGGHDLPADPRQA